MKYWNKLLIDNWRTESVSANFGLSIEQIKQIKKIAFDSGLRTWYSPKKKRKIGKLLRIILKNSENNWIDFGEENGFKTYI